MMPAESRNDSSYYDRRMIYSANEGDQSFKAQKACIREYFSGCQFLKKVAVPRSAGEIAWGAFRDCRALIEADIAKGVAYIGYCAFKDCVSLKKVSIPKSVIFIGPYAFKNCALETLELCSKDIGEHAFENCEALRELIITKDSLIIGYGAFNNCCSLAEASLSCNLVSPFAFKNCVSLSSVTFYRDVVLLPLCFYNCVSLHHVTFADSVSSIGGEAAFCGSHALTAVTLPAKLRRLEGRLFEGCESLQSITLHGTTYIDKKAFNEAVIRSGLCQEDVWI